MAKPPLGARERSDGEAEGSIIAVLRTALKAMASPLVRDFGLGGTTRT
jgi:hypothetical protein